MLLQLVWQLNGFFCTWTRQHLLHLGTSLSPKTSLQKHCKVTKSLLRMDGQEENQENKGTTVTLIPISPWPGLLSSWTECSLPYMPHTRHSPTVSRLRLQSMAKWIQEQSRNMEGSLSIQLPRWRCKGRATFLAKCPSCTGIPARM